MNYFYTRWVFKVTPDELDDKGPYHSTWETDRSMSQMLQDTATSNLESFYIIEFESKAELDKFFAELHETELHTD